MLMLTDFGKWREQAGRDPAWRSRSRNNALPCVLQVLQSAFTDSM